MREWGSCWLTVNNVAPMDNDAACFQSRIRVSPTCLGSSLCFVAVFEGGALDQTPGSVLGLLSCDASFFAEIVVIFCNVRAFVSRRGPDQLDSTPRSRSRCRLAHNLFFFFFPFTWEDSVEADEAEVSLSYVPPMSSLRSGLGLAFCDGAFFPTLAVPAFWLDRPLIARSWSWCFGGWRFFFDFVIPRLLPFPPLEPP